MEKENIWSAQDVIGMCEKYMNEDHVAMVRKACDFASYVHREQFIRFRLPEFWQI